MKFTFLTGYPFQNYPITLNKNKDNQNPFQSKYFNVLRDLMESYDYRLKQFYDFDYSTISNYDAVILVDTPIYGDSIIEGLDSYECAHADTDIFRLIASWLNIPTIFITNVSTSLTGDINEYTSSNFTIVTDEKILADTLSTFNRNLKFLLVTSIRIFDEENLKYLTKMCLRILNES